MSGHAVRADSSCSLPVRGVGRRAIVAALAVVASGLPMPLIAQSWPVKPVRIIVPLAPGGATDVIARLIGGRLGDVWGQTALVENRPGGSTMIGAEAVARAAPDGYTLLMATSAFPVNFSLQAKVPYQLADFTPVSNIAESPNVLAIHSSVPARNVKELIAVLRTRPGQINYGSGGVGGSTHLAAELFCAFPDQRLVKLVVAIHQAAFFAWPMPRSVSIRATQRCTFGNSSRSKPPSSATRVYATSATSASVRLSPTK